MNTPRDPTFLQAAEREWQAQEQALQRERAGAPLAGEDARGAQYRLIARALRQPALAPLPTDFAVRVAACAQAADDRLERLLQQALLGALAIAAAVIGALYGPAWWPAFARLLDAAPAQSVGWGLATAVGIALAGASGRWVDHAVHGRPRAGARSAR